MLSQRPLAAVFPGLAAGLIALFLLAGCTDDPLADHVADDVEGDIVDVAVGLDPETMRAEAAHLLATDRPWRAARVMRAYLGEVSDPSPEALLLTARAEAGWGGWEAVHDLLEDVPDLAALDDGIGLYLLGRAHDARGETPEAIDAYRAFLALPEQPDHSLVREAAEMLLGLALMRAGERAEARPYLDRSARRLGNGAFWLSLLEADALATTGDTEGVRQAVAGFSGGIQGTRAWRARIKAAHHAGDPAEAHRLAVQARLAAFTNDTRAEFFLAEGRAALELGDTATGRAALRGATTRDPAGPHAREAADLLRDSTMSRSDHLAVARVLRAQGLHADALDHYRAWLDSEGGTTEERTRIRIEYATALFYAEHFDEVEAALEPVADVREARRLLARTAAQLGDPETAERLYLQLADEEDNTILSRYLAADAHHHAGNADRAAALYRDVVARHGGSDLAGLARMRLAGIAWVAGDYAGARRIWDEVRSAGGTLGLQATYWAGRAREALGDSSEAAALYRAVRQRDRDSYYAVLASERLGEPFWPLPMGASPPADPAATARVAGWMRSVDLLREAGFPEDASAEAARIVGAAGNDQATRYALAEALIERGYSQRAIRIGQQLGGPNERLYRILYPFPYRRLIESEADERGFDPYIAAALIRQESLFEARATSHVGARGLMQIMPATGRALAAAAGIEDFDPEMLYHPEINVHLGTRYVAQHLDEFDGSLPSVFGAYNAGEHRVRWWSAYPEYGDDAVFAERIPFRETRDYVKILTTNHAVYEGLYGR